MSKKNIVRILFIVAIIFAIKIYYLDILNLTNKNTSIVKMKIEEKVENFSDNNSEQKINKRWLSNFWLKTDTSKILPL